MPNNPGHNVISFVAHQAARVEVHRHHCFQIVASIRGTFACTIGGAAFSNKKGFVVNQQVPHSCQAATASVIVFFIDAEIDHGRGLKELLGGQPFLDIEAFLTAAQLQRICAEGNQHLPTAELQKLADEIFASVLPAQTQLPESPLDKRVSQALEFIDAHLSASIRLEDLAEVMALSPERARHLFAETTGSPFSQYVLWKRIKQVIVVVLRGECSLTEAALKFGFADQAHFCRTFKRIFGTSPKAQLKNSRFVQFLNPLTE
ncbi:MAG: helix-turn-helix domain-containing protein [Blastocatellia bacterium]